MKKKLSLPLLAMLLLLVLTACGGTQTFTTAEDGLVLTVDNSWSQLDKEDGLLKAYGSADAEYQEIVACVLEQKGGRALLTVEKYDAAEYLEAQSSYVSWLRRQYEILPLDELDNWLDGQGHSTELLEAYRTAVVNNDLSPETIAYIEILCENQEWLSKLSSISDYTLLGQEEAEILGHKTQVLHYQYATQKDTIAEFIECSVIKDNMLYTISIWGDQKNFAKNLDDYQAILTNLAWAEEQTDKAE